MPHVVGSEAGKCTIGTGEESREPLLDDRPGEGADCGVEIAGPADAPPCSSNSLIKVEVCCALRAYMQFAWS
jgi:hypothetical protein